MEQTAANMAQDGEAAAEQGVEETVTFTVDPETADAGFAESERAELKAVIEAVIYITDEPLTPQQIASAIGRPLEIVKELLEELSADCAQPHRGLTVRQIAGGYKMATKPEHHEAVRAFVKSLKPALHSCMMPTSAAASCGQTPPACAPQFTMRCQPPPRCAPSLTARSSAPYR